MESRILNHALARAFLAGAPGVDDIVRRARVMLGRDWRWLRPLAERYLAAFAAKTRPRHRDVAAFLAQDEGLRQASARSPWRLRIATWLTEPQRMRPVVAAAGWSVPAIETAGALAAWLNLTPGEVDWFADLKGLGYKRNQPRLQHYHYRLLAKQFRTVRLIEQPKPRLKQLQRHILTGILDRIPAHPAVHGFVKRRSIRTFAGPHVGHRVVLKMDLQNYFPSFPAARVQALFRTMGYPDVVSSLLAGIVTNAAPRQLFSPDLRDARLLYTAPHLPQGAPTSPALANLCTYRADCRLAGLAQSAGAVYTRYADDLAFSGGEEFDRGAARFAAHVAAILHEEGFTVNHRKTRIMRRGGRQRVAGVVTNDRLNVPREDFDRLKAILTNCARQGAESQNRGAHPNFRAHLEGRVAFVESIHAAKGRRLRTILERIPWR